MSPRRSADGAKDKFIWEKPVDKRAGYSSGVVPPYPGIARQALGYHLPSDGVTRPAPAMTFEGKTVKPVTPDELREFELRNVAHLSELYMSMSNARVQKVVLEGGHIYVNEEPNDFHRHQLRITALLAEWLKKIGCDVKNVLFVDNHNPADATLDVEAYADEAFNHGWDVNHLFYEGDMVPIADIILATLEDIKLTVPSGEGVVLRKAGGVHLRKPECGGYSCALLDAAFTLTKHALLEADGIVNVLPTNMRQQQANTRAIVRDVLRIRALPFFNFFVDLNGNGNGNANHHPDARAGRPHQYT